MQRNWALLRDAKRCKAKETRDRSRAGEDPCGASSLQRSGGFDTAEPLALPPVPIVEELRGSSVSPDAAASKPSALCTSCQTLARAPALRINRISELPVPLRALPDRAAPVRQHCSAAWGARPRDRQRGRNSRANAE